MIRSCEKIDFDKNGKKLSPTCTRALRKASTTIKATRSNAEILRHSAASPFLGAKCEKEECPFDADVVDKNVENNTAHANKDIASKEMKRDVRAL